MRQKILKTAAERFSRYGYHKTTLEDIASDLNKVKSAIYYYFDNKEDILKAVIDTAIFKLSASIKDAVEKAVTPKEQLYAFITSHIQSLCKITQNYTSILELYFLEHGIVNEARSIYNDKTVKHIESILENGNKTNDFEVKNIKNAAMVVNIALKGAAQEYASVKSGNVKAMSEAMAEIFIKAFQRKK
jgi:Transcriptional regulator